MLALIALRALAAIAGAVGLGLPGLRLILGEPSASPPPTVAPSRTPTPGLLGSRLGLGRHVTLDEVETLTGVPVQLPSDPAIGPPDAVYVDRARGNQVALVWAASDALPETREPGIGLILMRFEGRVDDGFRQKLLGQGVTVERVTVDGGLGYWISGDAHFFFYIGKAGAVIDDDVLSERRGHMLADQARNRIDRSARRERHDHLDRLGRIRLCSRGRDRAEAKADGA